MNKGHGLSELMKQNIISVYSMGFTCKEVAQILEVSSGSVHNVLHAYNVSPTRRRRHQDDEVIIRKRVESRKGYKISESQRKIISEANKCNYNGLNGYGHTKTQNNGYILVYVPEHPHCHSDGYVMLHTVIMERRIGRYLEPDEVVHHINHDRTDNRIENLQLMNKHEHCSMHMRERHKQKKEGMTYQ